MLSWIAGSKRTTSSRSFLLSLSALPSRARARVVFLFVFACVVTLPPAFASAQTGQKFSVQTSALYADIYGDNFFALKGGFGVEAQLRYTLSAVSVGGGVQYTRHTDQQAVDDGHEGNMELLGVFFEPRYVIYVGSERMAPYVSARIAYARLDMENDFSDGTSLSWTSNGITLNGGGGLLVRLGSRTNFDIGATAGYSHYVESEGEFEGEPFREQLGSGTNLVLRMGLAIGVGR